VYVWLTAPWHIAHDRLVAAGRAEHSEPRAGHQRRHQLFQLAYDLVPYKKMMIDTSVTLVDEGVRKVVDQVI